jgi:hypothetical protein
MVAWQHAGHFINFFGRLTSERALILHALTMAGAGPCQGRGGEYFATRGVFIL